MVGNWTAVSSLKKGDMLHIDGMMSGFITEVINQDGMTTIKIDDIVIFNGPSHTGIIAFFQEKNKELFEKISKKL